MYNKIYAINQYRKSMEFNSNLKDIMLYDEDLSEEEKIELLFQQNRLLKSHIRRLESNQSVQSESVRNLGATVLVLTATTIVLSIGILFNSINLFIR